jgi:hypothetical protein
MLITPETPQQLERVFALQMMFLGLTVLLGLVVLIQYGSPSRRMNADGIYTAAPMYGVPQYPRPIEDYLDNDEDDTRSSASESHSSVQSSSETLHSSKSSSSQSRSYNRRTQRTRGGLRGRVTNDADESSYAPGWFWR